MKVLFFRSKFHVFDMDLKETLLKELSLTLGLTGIEKENFGCELYTEKGAKSHEAINSSTKMNNGSCANGAVASNESSIESEKYWKQEEQRSLELALQKYPKDTPARWDKIALFVSTKSKVILLN